MGREGAVASSPDPLSSQSVSPPEQAFVHLCHKHACTPTTVQDGAPEVQSWRKYTKFITELTCNKNCNNLFTLAFRVCKVLL